MGGGGGGKSGPYATTRKDRIQRPSAICEPVWPSGSIVQDLCESRGGRPGLSVLTSLLVSVDVKIY